MKYTIEDLIKKNRPNLSPNSARTYISILRNIYKKVYPDDEEIETKKYKNCNDFLRVLKDYDGSKRKTILSALLVVSDNCDIYRNLMIKDTREYNDKMKEHFKTDSQEDNWVSQDEIKTIYDNYEKKAIPLFRKKDITKKDIQFIQQYIILCLTSGIYIPPRRSLDWVDMKWKDYDRENDNYYDKRSFVFNKYKTSKFYKQQKIEVPFLLRRILNKWLTTFTPKIDYILYDSNDNKLNSVKFTQRLNSIFGKKKVSVNMLRHSFITDKYLNKNFSSLKDMNETAAKMGHSVLQHLEYIKKDEDDESDEERKK